MVKEDNYVDKGKRKSHVNDSEIEEGNIDKWVFVIFLIELHQENHGSERKYAIVILTFQVSTFDKKR